VTVVLVISGVERFDNFVIVCGEALRTDPPWRADNTHKCGVVDQRSRPDVFLYSDRADGGRWARPARSSGHSLPHPVPTATRARSTAAARSGCRSVATRH